MTKSKRSRPQPPRELARRLVSARGGGGGTPKKLGRVVRPASQNPYPIYDQNLRFSLPYLWPEVASSKKTSNPGLECKNLYPIYYQNGGKMTKSDTLFRTKTAEKPYPLAPHIPI